MLLVDRLLDYLSSKEAAVRRKRRRGQESGRGSERELTLIPTTPREVVMFPPRRMSVSPEGVRKTMSGERQEGYSQNQLLNEVSPASDRSIVY